MTSLRKFKKIAAFDFDNTIIDVNSDIFIDKLLLERDNINFKKNRYKYPIEVEELHDKLNWTHRMNGVFEFMHKEHNIRRDDLLNCLCEIKISKQMSELIKKLNENEYALAILSDANSIFIDTILKQNNLLNYFDKIFTNPAQFEDNERLSVKPFSDVYHKLNGSCCPSKICSTNICKGNILKSYVNDVIKEGNENKVVEHLIYVGDGHNDYCPGLNLNENDMYFVRTGYSLSKLLTNDAEKAEKLKCKIKYWSDASDIIKQL